jgi:hypothetical protein
MSKEHTPGPWVLGINDEDWSWSVMGGGYEITSLPFHAYDELVDDVAEADARLIAAAPDLLSALEEVGKRLAMHKNLTKKDMRAFVQMEAAIAKAKPA